MKFCILNLPFQFIVPELHLGIPYVYAMCLGKKFEAACKRSLMEAAELTSVLHLSLIINKYKKL